MRFGKGANSKNCKQQNDQFRAITHKGRSLNREVSFEFMQLTNIVSGLRVMYKANMPSLCLVAAISVLLVPLFADAQAILAPGGRTLFNKNILFRSFTLIQRQSILNDGSATETTYLQPIAVVYGFAPDWNATAVVPFVAGDDDGWADSSFFVKYDGLFKQNVPGGITRLSAELGVQAPTGADRFSTGAFAFSGDLVFEIARNQKFLLADVAYQIATRNEGGIEAGDRFGFDVSVAYLWFPSADENASRFRKLLSQIVPQGVFGILELNGQVQDRASNRSTELRDTGGVTLLLSPGIEYFLRENLIIDFSIPIPVVQDLNGEQPEPLVSVLIGFRYVL